MLGTVPGRVSHGRVAGRGAAKATYTESVSRLLLAGVLAALLLAGCGGSAGGEGTTSGAAEVAELGSLETLREAFNDGEGSARLVLLLSPT
jgi:hypothetical protein